MLKADETDRFAHLFGNCSMLWRYIAAIVRFDTLGVFFGDIIDQLSSGRVSISRFENS